MWNPRIQVADAVTNKQPEMICSASFIKNWLPLMQAVSPLPTSHSVFPGFLPIILISPSQKAMLTSNNPVLEVQTRIMSIHHYLKKPY